MLKLFHVEQSPKTPFIECDALSGVFHIKGRSLPEDAVGFYEPLFEWLDIYFQNPAKATTLTIQFEYLNSSSSKVLVDLIRKLDVFLHLKKTEILVNWYYFEGDDMLETGEHYKSITEVNFELVEVTLKSLL